MSTDEEIIFEEQEFMDSDFRQMAAHVNKYTDASFEAVPGQEMILFRNKKENESETFEDKDTAMLFVAAVTGGYAEGVNTCVSEPTKPPPTL